MQNGDDAETPVADRLQALRDYEEGWSTMAFHRHQLTSDPAAASVGSAETQVRCVPYLGSVIPTFAGSDLKLLRPSSPSRRISERRWTIPLKDLKIVPDFCAVDLCQDLVVVAGHRVDDSTACYCYLLSLNSSGRMTVHPHAHPALYTYSPSPDAMGGTTVRASVHGDLHGWLIQETFVPHGIGYILMVHNWKTGTRLLDVRASPEMTYSFFGHSALAIGYDDEVELYALCPGERGAATQALQRVCILRMPELSDPQNQLQIHQFALQAPRASSYDRGCLFRPDPGSAVLAVSFGVYDKDYTREAIFVLFVPLSSLLALVDAYAPKVDPPTDEPSGSPSSSCDAWASDDSDIRMFSWGFWAGKSGRVLRLAHRPLAVSAFGSRCGMAFTSLTHPDLLDIFVFDAHKWANAQHSRTSSDDNDVSHAASQFFCGLESGVVGPDLFEGSAAVSPTSRLPFRLRHKRFVCRSDGEPALVAPSGQRLAMLEDCFAYMVRLSENSVSPVSSLQAEMLLLCSNTTGTALTRRDQQLITPSLFQGCARTAYGRSCPRGTGVERYQWLMLAGGFEALVDLWLALIVSCVAPWQRASETDSIAGSCQMCTLPGSYFQCAMVMLFSHEV
ncbi:hypothetical protein OH77DRAFT_900128 [Trametes cingulata]|nr:hypothetical protein OH77DRAFT_900128 [Trametes cingulata]